MVILPLRGRSCNTIIQDQSQTPISLGFAIILKIGLEAARGDMKAAEMWVDRIYGKVPQSMDVSTTNNGPLVAIIQNVDVVKAAENITEGKVVDVTPEDPSTTPPSP